MATFVKFDCFNDDLGKGLHHLNSAGDTLKVYLTNNTPSVAGDVKVADLLGITEEHGYAAADIANDYTTTSGVGSLTGSDVVWTASGGDFGPFRYVVLFNDTAADDPLIAYWDYGSSISVVSGETFTVDFGATVLTIT